MKGAGRQRWPVPRSGVADSSGGVCVCVITVYESRAESERVSPGMVVGASRRRGRGRSGNRRCHQAPPSPPTRGGTFEARGPGENPDPDPRALIGPEDLI